MDCSNKHATPGRLPYSCRNDTLQIAPASLATAPYSQESIVVRPFLCHTPSPRPEWTSAGFPHSSSSFPFNMAVRPSASCAGCAPATPPYKTSLTDLVCSFQRAPSTVWPQCLHPLLALMPLDHYIRSSLKRTTKSPAGPAKAPPRYPRAYSPRNGLATRLPSTRYLSPLTPRPLHSPCSSPQFRPLTPGVAQMSNKVPYRLI